VTYEIEKSIERGNGLLGVLIHNIKHQHRRTQPPGKGSSSPHDWQLPHLRLEPFQLQSLGGTRRPRRWRPMSQPRPHTVLHVPMDVVVVVVSPARAPS
jgi:hypothetical protein